MQANRDSCDRGAVFCSLGDLYLFQGPFFFFFFNDTATTEIYTLSLHDALPISACSPSSAGRTLPMRTPCPCASCSSTTTRSEEHTSELQSLAYLVCRLLLEKKK